MGLHCGFCCTKIKNISVTLGQKQILKDVSIHIHCGHLTVLIGKNGAGKSTMMKIITGYIRPDHGTVRVCGQEINGNSTEVRRLIGYLPEHNPLYLDMYVREFLLFTAGIFHLDNAQQRVDEMIGQTGLSPEADKRIGQLSKGYRQRVGLAQALIHNPKVLILDEPTTGLDPNQIEEVRELIRSVARHKVVLLSTHIMQEVEAVCSRAIIIDHGHIVSDDLMHQVTSQQLTERFHHLTQHHRQ